MWQTEGDQPNGIGTFTFHWPALTSAVCARAGVLFCEFDIVRLLTDGMRGWVEVLHLWREREPPQRVGASDANYRCHPSALGMQ